MHTLGQAAADAPSILYQYGAIGLALVGTGWAVKILFQREIRAHDLDRQRADRAEEEVRRLNQAIQDKMLPVLFEATKVISDALREIQRKER